MKVTFYTEPHWAFGTIHTELCARLGKYGIESDISDSTVGYPTDHFAQKLKDYDAIVTDPGASVVLIESYNVPREKIILISHGEPDIQFLIDRHGRGAFDLYRGFSVVSESLYASCLTIGIRTPSHVLRLGVNCARYDMDISPTLKRVGFGGIMSRQNSFGVEIKRGKLVEICAQRAGLTFVPTSAVSGGRARLPFEEMPSYYRQVDAVVMSSLQEGAGLPPLEAAASGRLVIGTPCGHFPRLAYHGIGIMAPLTDDAFVEFTTSALIYYRDNPVAYREKCMSTKQAAQYFDWSCCEMTWAKFLHAIG